MKKIIFLFLSFIYAFSSCTSLTFDTSLKVGDCYNGNVIKQVILNQHSIHDDIGWYNNHCSYQHGSASGYFFNRVNFKGDGSSGCFFDIVFQTYETCVAPHSTCSANEHVDSATNTCVCDSGYKLQYEQCRPDCSHNIPTTAPADSGWVKYTNIDTAQQCSSLASGFDYNQANFASQTDSRGCVYNVCYVNEESADINDSVAPYGPPPCTKSAYFPDTPYGFILKGTVKSLEECQAYVDNVEYTDFKVLIATDCSGDYKFCYLKTSVDNNDTGVPPPNSDSNDSNISNVVPPVTPPLPADVNNTDLSGVNAKLQQSNSLDSIRNQKLNDIANVQGQFKNLMGAWINQSRLDNHNQLNAQRQNISASNRVKNSIDSLHSGLGGKLDTLIKDTQKIVDKNNSVDLSGVESKLDKLHKDINSSNDKLSKIADAFNTDKNVTYPVTALDDNSSAPSLSDLLPSDSWFSSNSLDLSSVNNYTGDCYLESFTWTDGSGVHTFPPQDLINMIPFNIVSNIMLAFLYLLGLRDFLRS